MVQTLSGRARLAIITNGLKAVQRPRFAASALRDYFDVIVISEEEGVAKPDPRIFDIAFTRMGWPAKARRPHRRRQPDLRHQGRQRLRHRHLLVQSQRQFSSSGCENPV